MIRLSRILLVVETNFTLVIDSLVITLYTYQNLFQV